MEAQYPYGRFAGLSTAPAEEIPADNGVMTTNEKLAALTQEKESLEKELTEVEAEIEYQKKLRDLEVSGDPLWEMAKEKYVQTGDMGDLQSIMTRQNTKKTEEERIKYQRDMLEAQKKHDEAKTKSAYKQAYQTAEDGLEYAIQDARNNLNDPSVRDRVMLAYKSFKNAAFDYGYDTSDVEKALADRYLGGQSIRQYLGLDDAPASSSLTQSASSSSQGSGSLVQATQNFEAAKSAENLNGMAKAYKDAKAKGENPDTLNARKNTIEALYKQKHEDWKKQKESYEKSLKAVEKLKTYITDGIKERHFDSQNEAFSEFVDTYKSLAKFVQLKNGKAASAFEEPGVEPKMPSLD